jgi:hypothetical protein
MPRSPAKTTKKSKPAAKKAAGKAVHGVNRVDVFVAEYLVDLNGRQAAIRAGYSAQSARQTASELLATSEVQEKVQAKMTERMERVGITADDVVVRLRAIADADPRELIELHRVCCRYCWGKGHKFQYTPRELAEAKETHADENRKLIVDGKKPRKFSEAGGIGYSPKNDPNPSCPECFGDGVERVFAKDTRDLSPEARRLYAGVKTTQHGLEIKMHGQTEALVNIGKHLGVFKERVELTGKDGGPVAHSMNDILAAIDGAGTGLPRPGGNGGS